MGLDQRFTIKKENNEIIYEQDLRKVNCIQGYFEDIEETYQVSKEMLKIINNDKNIIVEYWCWY